MSVSRSGDEGWTDRSEPLRYNDLVVQSLPARIGHPDADLTGQNPLNNNFRWAVSPVQKGGLDRGEMAELVRMEVRFRAWLRTSNIEGDTEPGYMDHTIEIGTLPGWNTDEDDGDATAMSDPLNQDDTIETTLLQGNVSDNEVWYFDRLPYHSPFNDTVNGTGGMPSPVVLDHNINFLDFLDEGPVIDQFTDINFVLDEQFGNITNAPRLQVNVAFWWNVFEIPTEDRRALGGP